MRDRDGSKEQRHLRIEGTEPDGFLGMFDRLAIVPCKCQAVAEIAVGCRGTRVEPDRPAKRRDRFFAAFFHQGQIAERDLSPGIAVIDGGRANGVLTTDEQAVIAIDPAHMRREQQAKRQQASRRRVVRMGLNGTFESVDRGLVVGACQTPDMSLRASDQFPGSKIVGGSRKGANGLGREQARFDGGDDAAGDFILYSKNIPELAVVALRPMMTAGR